MPSQRGGNARTHAGSIDDVEVLGSLQVHPGRSQRSAEDEDRALAKALQEQERAFLQLQGESPGEFGENYYDGEGHDEEGSASDLAFARRLQAEEMQSQYSRLLDMAGPRRGTQEGNQNLAEGHADESDDEQEDYMSDDEVDPDNMTYEELQALADTVGSVSRGLPTHIIDSLPISRYHRQAPLPAAANSSNSILIDLCTPDGRTGRAGVPIISIDDTPEQQVRGPSQEVQCTVCCMELEDGEHVMRLPCGHFYHPDCIRPWLALNKACPICSREVGAPLAQVLDTALRSRNH